MPMNYDNPPIPIPNPPDVRLHPITGKEMIRIPAGHFLYGKKKKKLHLPEFWLAEAPVTNAEYARFVAATAHEPPKHWQGAKSPTLSIANHPVVRISWYDAQAFATWANCRLPTEEEWEKAARGVDGREFPWGNTWRNDHCNSREAGIDGTSPVGQFSPQGDSPYGCVDMSGNVWEWTASTYQDDKEWICLRGGAFHYGREDSQTVSRSFYDPEDEYFNIGFRVAEQLSTSGS